MNVVFILQIFLSIITVFFALVYVKKILYAKQEYDLSKDIIKSVTLTTKNKIEKQNERVEQLAYEIETMYSSIEKINKNDNNYEEKISYLIESLTSIMQVNKKLSHNLIILNKKIDEIKSSTNDLKVRMNTIDIPNQKGSQKKIQKNTPLNYLTSTEKRIIQLLLEEKKTAPEIQRNIRKTREHTSRLLKKLWQEGYIERETHTIPFIYRPTKELESRISSQTS